MTSGWKMQLNLKENMPSNMQTTEQMKIGN